MKYIFRGSNLQFLHTLKILTKRGRNSQKIEKLFFINVAFEFLFASISGTGL